MEQIILASIQTGEDGKLQLTGFFGPFDSEDLARSFAARNFIGEGQIPFIVFPANSFIRGYVDGELSENKRSVPHPSNHYLNGDGVMCCRCHDEPSGSVDVIHEVVGRDMPEISKAYFCRWTERKPPKNGKTLTLEEAIDMTAARYASK